MNRLFGLNRCFLLLSLVAATAVAGTLSGRGQGEGANRKPPFSLTIAARNSSIKAGSPVWVDVSLRNTSDHRIAVYRAVSEDMDQGGWVYQIDVRDERGTTPAKTGYALNIGRGESSGGPVPLDAGKTLTQSVKVSKLYNLPPGKYKIQFQRFDEESKTFVASNVVAVTVTP